MKYKSVYTFAILCLITTTSCSQNQENVEKTNDKETEKEVTTQKEPHRYGGWFCPDNLNGFPAVDIKKWATVPVVNGRMATKEETQNGTSLIFVDMEKYPNAKPLDITMPKLAKFHNTYSGKEETIIVIQALNIDSDSVVGFRYLNGGNGSAHLNEVRFLTDVEIENMAPSRFVTLSIDINAAQDEIWKVLTKPELNKTLLPIYDKEQSLTADWRKKSEVNFYYSNGGNLTGAYADKLFGNFYIQIDKNLGQYNYVEKFFLSDNKEAKTTKLQIVCGPYADDYENQKIILNNWAKEVKALSEK